MGLLVDSPGFRLRVVGKGLRTAETLVQQQGLQFGAPDIPDGELLFAGCREACGVKKMQCTELPVGSRLPP